MIKLTEGVERTGPHPSRDVSELEARAKGCIKPPYLYAHPGTIYKLTPDNRENLFWAKVQCASKDGATEAECAATAAFLTMAGNAHGVLVEALTEARAALLLAGFCGPGEWGRGDPEITNIDTALNAAHGRK